MLSGKKKKIQLAILLVIFIIPILTETTNGQIENPDPVFSISLLCPNSYGYIWVSAMVEQLPKIGIEIDVFDHTGWAQISPRTWGHPGPYPVPSYAEGGFDILALSFDWSLDINFTELFDSDYITPIEWNFYQYESTEMDWALRNYSQTFVLADRIQYAQDIQAILYEDIPQATVKYPLEVYPHDPLLVGDSWDPLLWYEGHQDMAYWEIPGKTEFHYGTPVDSEEYHPYHLDSYYDYHWISQIYGGLTERFPIAPYNNAFAPYGCTSFSTSNGINYTVQIDPNLVFADGTKCNASDVKYSYDLLINPKTNHPEYDFYSQYIDNKTIEIISEYEIKANFLHATPFQDNNLGIDILPRHVWDSILPEDQEAQAATWVVDDVLDSNIMGIGPYYLEDFDEITDVIHLKANPYWTDWGGHAEQKFTDIYFDFISNSDDAFSALDAGTLDMVDSDFVYQFDQIPETVNYTIVNIPASTEFAFNMKHPILGTGELCPKAGPESAKHIRKAISHMIPRDVFCSEIFDGFATPGITTYPEGAIGFDDTLIPYHYSINLAVEHMKLAGYYIDLSNVGSSLQVGLGLKTILGILTFIGGSIRILININKRKRG